MKNMKDNLLERGLTKERLNQMLSSWNGDIEQVYAVVDDWGVRRCNRGYDEFDFEGLGLLEISRIDDVDCFNDDEEAARQAEKDGIKIIPIDELPDNFDRKYFGWVDTPENRKAIQDYCKEDNYFCNGNSLM